ncbi:MAG: hypothetical protein K0R31_1420, partial [Clostridiales bacterium]|nr:hypothetical protein [Clostridiales bacterium]
PVQVSNSSGQSITIDVNKLNGLTNPNGDTHLMYVPGEKKTTSKLTDPKRAIAQYLTGTSKITLKAGQTKTVHYKLSIPGTLTDGTIVGGLAFEQEGQKLPKTNKGKLTIGNVVERTIGVEGDFAKKGSGNVVSSKPSIMVTPSAPYFLIHLTNNSPQIISDVQFNYKVQQAGKNLFLGEISSFKMGPKNSIGYQIPWNYKKFTEGQYTLHLRLMANGKITNYSYNITVPKQNVANYQEETQPVKPVAETRDNNIIQWLFALGGVLIGAVIVILIFYMNKRKKTEKEKKSRNG